MTNKRPTKDSEKIAKKIKMSSYILVIIKCILFLLSLLIYLEIFIPPNEVGVGISIVFVVQVIYMRYLIKAERDILPESRPLLVYDEEKNSFDTVLEESKKILEQKEYQEIKMKHLFGEQLACFIKPIAKKDERNMIVVLANEKMLTPVEVDQLIWELREKHFSAYSISNRKVIVFCQYYNNEIKQYSERIIYEWIRPDLVWNIYPLYISGNEQKIYLPNLEFEDEYMKIIQKRIIESIEVSGNGN